MSRRDQIVKEAESLGWTVTRIEWEAIGAGGEMSGPSGGWDVELTRGDRGEWAGGYNYAQVIEWIRNFDRPLGERTDPFACSGNHTRRPGDCALARGHRGEHMDIVALRGVLR